MATNIRYILRNDIASNWEDKNTLLLKGEPGYDITNNRLKFGNGSTPWNDLPYLAPEIVDDLTTGGSDKILSAEQGKVLDGKKVNVADVVNNLTSTSTTAPLSAAQGKELKALIDAKPNSSGATYSNATQSAAGLMSAADKKKLDGVAEGATKVNVSSETWTFTLSSGSTVTKKVAIMS